MAKFFIAILICYFFSCEYRKLLEPKSEIDVTIHVKGDINGDGKVNVSDVSMLAAHVKGEKPVK
ncbi:dockerin type I repeat-containing protein [Ruminococcus albus]|uniref:dockerin type I repeat-containing protein n=1 Tax=Ruminococcus albus TaxID=1264 RepID=UPI0039EFD9E3